MSDRVLAEQLSYYEQRAPEYDDWWLRRGRYDLGPSENAQWATELAIVAGALNCLDVSGDVLELAPGTGQWSRQLRPRCSSLTLVDGSPAMLSLNPAAQSSRTVVADLFEWTTDEQFDVVAFGFWLSHVPDALLAGFLRRVAGWLKPGGRIFYVDSRPYASRVSPALVSTDGDLHTRRLTDGREFTIVKAFRTREELQAAFDEAGLRAEVKETPTLFQYATG